uniref:HAT C-terminal dimerisation domain-containing protein n=1 Tax=Latimeria chalumnae TaxID=7897 RepID=H3B0B2_LATCH
SLSEVHWLSRHFAVHVLMKNYDVLLDYCTEQVRDSNDSVSKYCLKRLNDLQYRVALATLDDVLEELTNLSQLFQKSSLSTIEACSFAKAKIAKLCAKWNEDVKAVLAASIGDTDTSSTLMFIERACEHLERRFPADELKQWAVFDLSTLAHVDFAFGKDDVAYLAAKHASSLNKPAVDICRQITPYIVAEKMRMDTLKTFSDLSAFVLKEEQFSDLPQLVDICGTFQASSTDCEQRFSLMNNIKTKLEADHLDKVMRVKSHVTAGGMVDLDAVYIEWKAQKDRQEK